MTARIINHHGEEDRCHYCDVPFVNGQCPECKSIKLTELWRRQDMDEMLRAQVERDLKFTVARKEGSMKHPITQAIDPTDAGRIGCADRAGRASHRALFHGLGHTATIACAATSEATDWLLRAGPIAKKMNRESKND